MKNEPLKFLGRGIWMLGALGAAVIVCAEDAPPTQGAEAGPYAPPAKMQLTVQQTIELALQNNLDIAIQQLDPQVAAETIEQERGRIYDPTLKLRAVQTLSNQPNVVSNIILSTTVTSRQDFSFDLSGRLPLGTQYSLQASLASYHNLGSGSRNNIATADVTVRQPLLKNGWLVGTAAPIWVARKNKDISDQNFAQKVMDVVRDTENACYDLVFTIDQRRVQEEALTLARTLLAENKKKLEVGILSPLEVVQAESGVAKAESDLILAERLALNQENVLKRLVSHDVYSLRKTRVELMESPAPLPIAHDVEESIRQGLLHRPEYIAAKTIVDREKINVRYTRNQAFPELDIVGSYSTTADRTNSFDSIADIFRREGPSWSGGVELTYPIPYREGTSAFHIARLHQQIALEQLKKTEQTIIVEVDNASGTVESNFKRVQATQNARHYAEESLKAEQTKFNAGTSTSFLVLQAQQQLTAARGDEIKAIADYNKSIAELHRAEGTILQLHNVTLQPAKR